MRIIYISKTCSMVEFEKIYNASKVKPQQQDQKFHQMLLEGLASQSVEVISISSRPINRKNLSKVFFLRKKEIESNIAYRYLGFVNFKILRQITLMISLFFTLCATLFKKRQETVVMIDVLNLSLSKVARFLGKLFRVPVVAVVTDLPNELEYQSNYYKKQTTKIARSCDAYVILVDAMQPFINPHHKPQILIEGMVRENESLTNEKFDKYTLLYAGGLSESSGIRVLIEGFIQSDSKDKELLICGMGQLEGLIQSYTKQHTNIKYLGSLLNNEVLILEEKSHLLINPRDSLSSQTKYAFPSKILEYLYSGTPILSTKLDGIPPVYYNYLIPVEDESVNGFKNALNKIYEMTLSDLNKIGIKGRAFAQNEKTNIIQAKKCIDWLDLIQKGRKK